MSGANLLAEESLVGAVLLEPACLARIRDIRPEHLTDTRLRTVYAEVLELDAQGAQIDLDALAARLNGRLETVGGRSALLKLRDRTPTAETVRVYADAIIDAAKACGVEPPDWVAEELPPEAYAREPRANGKAPESPPAKLPRRPLDWDALETQEPPERAWAIEHWLGMGHVTLMAGAAGTGKTLIAQTVGSCLALRRGDFLDWMPAARKTLLWACEDDAAELWRRQVAIARWLGVPLSAFADRLIVHSYDGQLVELAALVDQQLVATPMLTELREQIGDYKAEYVILDNVARLYAGSENDRHQVTSFVAMLTGAAASMQAGMLLLGHPGRAQGSEFSGSSAWEASVRARLYLGRTLPDDDDEPEQESPTDDGVRYLCRRKANYSARDWRRLQYRDGVMVPDAPVEAQSGGRGAPSDEWCRDVITRAVRKLAEMGEHGVASSNSPKYLPRLAKEYKLLDRLSEKQFAATMRTMRTAGQLVMRQVGLYANRTPREALALPETQA